ncbi:MAG: hypothetical protein ACI9YB_003098, partial [Halioglobus sp.]
AYRLRKKCYLELNHAQKCIERLLPKGTWKTVHKE